MKNLLRIALLCMVAFPSGAFANPAPIGGPGHSLVPVVPRSVNDIRIESEKLVITDGGRDSIPAFSGQGEMSIPCVDYKAVYRLVKTSPGRRTLKVGFPSVTYSYTAGGSVGGVNSISVVYGGKNLVVRELSKTRPTIYPRRELHGIERDLLAAGLAKPVSEAPGFVDLASLGGNREEAARALAGISRWKAKRRQAIIETLDRVVYGDDDFVIRGQCLIWYVFDLTLEGRSRDLEISYKSPVPFANSYDIVYLLGTSRYWAPPRGKLQVVFEPDRKFLEGGGRYDFGQTGEFIRSGAGRYILRDPDPSRDVFIHRSGRTGIE